MFASMFNLGGLCKCEKPLSLEVQFKYICTCIWHNLEGYLHTWALHTASSHPRCNTREPPLSPVVNCSCTGSPPVQHSHTACPPPPWQPRSIADRDLCGWCWPGRGSRIRRLYLCNRPLLLLTIKHAYGLD